MENKSLIIKPQTRANPVYVSPKFSIKLRNLKYRTLFIFNIVLQKKTHLVNCELLHLPQKYCIKKTSRTENRNRLLGLNSVS